MQVIEKIQNMPTYDDPGIMDMLMTFCHKITTIPCVIK